ncbi:MAG: class I SAM-dependent methyltransferase [Pseudomonadota bacterium]
MSEHFDAAWLALRESADHGARPGRLVQPLCDEWTTAGQQRYRIVDLGSGTGSNLRYLAPRLARCGEQEWTLVDHDAALLAQARAPCAGAGVRVVRADLAAGDLPLPPECDLVTGSALLDLVSREWLEGLLESCRNTGAAVLFALSYDGRVRWSVPDSEDERVREAVNRHQRSDKGWGPALGPDATTACVQGLQTRGYRVLQAASPWVIDSRQAALGQQLVRGWVDAATALEPERSMVLRAWGERRIQALDAGEVTVTVSHQDVLGLPSG